MGDLAFGQSFEGIQAQKTHWAITSIRDSETALGLLGPIPWLLHLMTKLPNFMNPMQKLLLFSEESVEKRRQMEPPEPDIMSYLLNADQFFSDPVKEYQLFTGDARLLIIAGSDTTAMSLTFLFYHLASDPTLQQRLYDELLANNITTSEDVTVSTVKDLPYLNALLNENLRIHPPVPSFSARDTPPEGLQVGSISIPGDITVYTPLYSIQRSRAAFDQPEDFIPERWTTRPELIRNKKAFAPFLIGPQSCIGRQLAYNEMRTVVCKLVLKFTVRLADGETGKKLLEESEDVFTVTIKPLKVVFAPRKTTG
jgi:cytochrome P450 family 628